MSDEAEYYKPSGNMDTQATMMNFAMACVAAAVLGASYAYLVHFMPLVYINFLCTCGFGYGMGHLARMTGERGKVRNAANVKHLGVALALVGLYVSWAVHIGIVWGLAGGSAAPIFNPAALWESINALNSTGTWGMRDYVPTGFALWCIWLVEGAIVIAGAALMAR